MRFSFTTEPGSFLDRPNRYLVLARLHGTGEVVRAHCPDPGRLRELLIPGVTVHVSPAAGPLRTTTHTLRFVEHPESGTLVSLVSQLANALFREGLEAGALAPFAGWEGLSAEVPVPDYAGHGVRSRIDYRLTYPDGRECWVEVKSATLVEGRTAYFPDAVTERGRRHVGELEALVRAGHRAAVCFVVQRPDAEGLRPQWDRDPAFAQALLQAVNAGVECYAWRAAVTQEEARILEPIVVMAERPPAETASPGVPPEPATGRPAAERPEPSGRNRAAGNRAVGDRAAGNRAAGD